MDFQPFALIEHESNAAKYPGIAGLKFESDCQEHWKADFLQSSFQCFLNPDCRERLGSGDVQCVTVRHGW